MCGIAGIINRNQKAVEPEVIRRMQDTIVHRGPDDGGHYFSENIGLGHRRLSIIDLSDLGHQPMCNEDGSIWIVFNGEIYNYETLNRALSAQGHQIKSHCDTETIVHLYEEYGVDCVHHLRGMFSFAIWDSRKKRLFAAVDRLRIKPFYYSLTDNHLVFASELKAIQASGLAPREINYEAIHHYLSMQAVPVPQTIYKNSYTLPGGYFLLYENGDLNVQPYWDIPTGHGEIESEETYQKNLRNLLYESVEMRLMSDVPLGAFLSGGIDSSLIVGLMSQMRSDPIKTFSIGYDVGGAKYDDTHYAKLVSRKFNTDHTVKTISADMIYQEIRNFIFYLDQPSSDAINSYFVSQLAAEDVTVVLCGQGGDELFAGYSSFHLIPKLMDRDARWEKLPAWFRQYLAFQINRLPDPLKKTFIVEKLNKFLQAYGSWIRKYEQVRMELFEHEKQALYSSDMQSVLHNCDSHHVYRHHCKNILNEPDSVTKVSYMDLKVHLGDVLMRDVDVMSMAYSLETRVPLIDHKLVEFGMSIPSELKLNNGQTKKIFIDSVRDILPEEVISRQKLGFAFPLPVWLKNELKPLMDFVLSKETIEERGLFEYDAVKKIKYEFLSDKNVNYRRVWGLIILELWLRLIVDQDDDFYLKMQHHCHSQLRKKSYA